MYTNNTYIIYETPTIVFVKNWKNLSHPPSQLFVVGRNEPE